MLSGKSLRIPEERATQIRIGLHGTTVLLVRRNGSTAETRKKIIRAVGTAMMRFDGKDPMESLKLGTNAPETAMLDSGTNRSMVNERKYFDTLDEGKKKHLQLAKRDATLKVEGVGQIGQFNKVYYCPEADSNLFSISVLCDLGYNCVFTKDEVLILDGKGNKIEAKGVRDNSLYFVTLNELLKFG
jgi:hypothetical protein